MFVGYIVNGTHPFLQALAPSEIKKVEGTKPILIVGVEAALKLYPKVNLSTKVVDPNKLIYYCFDEGESKEKYKENLHNFISNCLAKTLENYKVISLVDLTKAVLTPTIFYYETKAGISIVTENNVIYYINKSVSRYFEKEKDLDLKGINVISWGDSFSACMKANGSYLPLQDSLRLFRTFNSEEIYFSAFCFEWFKQLDFTIPSIKLWERAYKVEQLLSKQLIKIDSFYIEERIELEANTILETIAEKVIDGYVHQIYNGTDKTTGRMFPQKNDFSIQTLTKPLRRIVIAEPKSYLIEFDYKYFEYTLLGQLVGLPINEDPHEDMAVLIFNDKSQRQVAKNINYGLLYGQSLNTLIDDLLKQHTLKFTKKELHALLKKVTAPIEKFEEELFDQFDKKGSITNFFGREIYPQKRYACLNNYIQSTAADFVIIKLEKLFDLLSSTTNSLDRVVLQNHDSILVNLSIDAINNSSLVEDIKLLLEAPENGLKAQIEINYGRDWSFS